MFDAKLTDAFHVLRLERGEGENPGEQFDRMARDRMQSPAACPWWSSDE